ncbi:hypothetical protein ACHAWF_017412 [Thalassiosira exigua]
MPKSTRPAAAAAQPAGCPPVPTDPPVPGVDCELGTLLVRAVKARRKFLSKSSSAESDAPENLRNGADDATTAFLRHLRRRAEASTSPRARCGGKDADAPARCLAFLLEVLSDGAHSLRLRRAALALAGEILDRSADARAYLAGEGGRLLDLASVVEAAGDEPGGEEPTNGGADGEASPASTFRREATELVHRLASRFGRFYAQFVVASRLLGDASVGSSSDGAAFISDGGARLSKKARMSRLRRERDTALAHGEKACRSSERMVERADECFRVLVPRFGGFNVEATGKPKDGSREERPSERVGKANLTVESSVSNCKDDRNNDNNCGGGGGVADDAENDSDDSIDWEEGDDDFSEEQINDSTQDASSVVDPQVAIEQTMDIMERAGALLDGELAVQVTVDSIGAEEAPIERATAASQLESATSTISRAEVRRKLETIVKKLSTRQLPRFHQWIHALSHADGMHERAVADPAPEVGGAKNGGPVSLVLLPESKRALRRVLLQRMMKVRGEIESVLQSAARLGIRHEGSESGNLDDRGGTDNVVRRERSGHGTMARVKRQWMPEMQPLSLANRKRKPKKKPRFIFKK